MRTTLCVLAVVASAAVAEERKVTAIEPKAASALIEKKQAVLIDVREQEEIAGGMAKPAQWFAMSRMQAEPAAFEKFLAGLPKGRVIFYCAAGGRAGKAAEKAVALGYEASNMGGYDAWAAAGLPTRKP